MRSVTSLIVVVLAFVAFAALTVVLAHGRVALVVGNSTYAHIGRLPNPDNDARDISATLRRLGFEVTTDLDARSSEFLPRLPIWVATRRDASGIFPSSNVLSQVWIGSRDPSSSRAALPMRYSATGQQTDHPLRAVRALTDEALRSMSTQLERLYSTTGRLSSPPEQLLRALLFRVHYGVRSERLLMEGLQPAVPLVRRVEHGGASDARRRRQPARGEEPLS